MSTLFLFGAGASYGSLHTRPYSPPLGAQLFEDFCAFSPTIADKCAPYRDTFLRNFEDGMRLIYHEEATFLSRFVCELARYFLRFHCDQGNVYINLMHSLQRRARHCTFATLNYDFLLDEAILRSGYRLAYKYGHLPKNTVSMLKIHGSINFLPPKNMWKSFRHNEFESWRSLDYGGRIFDMGGMLGSKKDVLEFCDIDGQGIGPGISLFAKGKPNPYQNEIIKIQREDFSRALKNSARVVIVGVNINIEDAQIWGLFERFPRLVIYVNPETEAFVDWAKSVQLRKPRVLTARFAEIDFAQVTKMT